LTTVINGQGATNYDDDDDEPGDEKVEKLVKKREKKHTLMRDERNRSMPFFTTMYASIHPSIHPSIRPADKIDRTRHSWYDTYETAVYTVFPLCTATIFSSSLYLTLPFSRLVMRNDDMTQL
jgi:hypothetical protein